MFPLVLSNQHHWFFLINKIISRLYTSSVYNRKVMMPVYNREIMMIYRHSSEENNHISLFYTTLSLCRIQMFPLVLSNKQQLFFLINNIISLLYTRLVYLPPLILGLFCGKWPMKIRQPMTLRHPVSLYRIHLQKSGVSRHKSEILSRSAVTPVFPGKTGVTADRDKISL